MLVTTADVIPGQEVELLGLVRGNIVSCKNIARDVMAGVKQVVGGEIKSYTELTTEARSIAEDRMIQAAEELGANAVVACRFSTAAVQAETIEMLCYGTAVKFV